MRLPVLLSLLLAAGNLIAAPIAEIPFQFVDGFIILKAHVEGNARPLHMLLDSGAGASVVSFRTAERLRLPLGAVENVLGVGSQALAAHVRPVQVLAGKTALSRISLALDLDRAAAICSQPIDGLIGADFFAGRVVQIDFTARCVRLFAADSVSSDGTILPLEIRRGILCVPVAVNGSSPRWTRLDTGCNDALHWVVPRSKEAKSPRAVSVGFLTDSSEMVHSSVQLGGESLQEIETSLHGRALFPGEAGLLGNGVLSRYVVTVDAIHRRVILQRAANSAL